jgi:hypothetical protein
MTIGDIPQIRSYASNTIAYAPVGSILPADPPLDSLYQNALQCQNVPYFQASDLAQYQAQQREIPMTNRRIVKVFIADTDENVPLDESILYEGEQRLTDLTDQELFFEINIKDILDGHNAHRTTLVNKKVKERVEHLEPAKIRDLKMVVVNVAQF